ncbi:hypothetical protein [Streptomyces sp. NPDC001401]|uniref:hypothetical protein n=1 Tax=Streptomyces sp. NPDC001401 TaxID=3364570 RepID=UPI0036D13083
MAARTLLTVKPVRRLMVALVSAALALAATISAAHADAKNVHSNPYAAQASELGLSSAQAADLQKRVDSYLASQGGTQVAANKILLNSGGDYILLALPGEKNAHETAVSLAKSAAAGASCDYLYFCAYTNTNFNGDILAFKTCWIHDWHWPYIHGSWINHQTPGTRVEFKSSDWVTRWTSPGAYSSDDDADWSWVWHVKAC